MGFQEKSFDETTFAQSAAAAINTNHTTFLFDQDYSDEKLFSLYEKLDSPNGDSGLIPIYFLCQRTSERFKVAIGGDGGDEVFFGYDTHVAFCFARYFSLFPKFFEHFFGHLGKFSPASGARLPLALKMQRLSRGLKVSPAYWACSWMSCLDVSQINQLLDQNFTPEEIFDEALSFWESTDSGAEDKFNSYYLNIYLPDKVLSKVDRASMLNGLEVRAPLLDKNLFEYCTQFSIKNFYNSRKRKLVLRKFVSRYIDQKIAQRPKAGFGSPVSALVRRPRVIERILSHQNLNKHFLRSLLKCHTQQQHDYGQALWNTFVLSFDD